MANKLITFNCSGTPFTIRRATIERYPDSMLARRIQSGMREDYFIDRCPRIFEIVLQFYRTGKIHVPITEEIEDEFDYFCLDVPKRTDLNTHWFWDNHDIRNFLKIVDYYIDHMYKKVMQTQTVVSFRLGPPIEQFRWYRCFFFNWSVPLAKRYLAEKYNLQNVEVNKEFTCIFGHSARQKDYKFDYFQLDGTPVSFEFKENTKVQGKTGQDGFYYYKITITLDHSKIPLGPWEFVPPKIEKSK